MKLTMTQKILMASGYVGPNARVVISREDYYKHGGAGAFPSSGGNVVFTALLAAGQIKCRPKGDMNNYDIPGLEELFRSFEDEEEKVRKKRKPANRRADSRNAGAARKPKAKRTGRAKLHKGKHQASRQGSVPVA